MTFNPAINRYVDLIQTKPQVILNCGRHGRTAEAIATLRERESQFNGTYVEIGSGSGGHLIQQALANPDKLFVGFELRYKRLFRTAEKAEQLRISNILLLKQDAANLAEFFAEDSLGGVFILFPDPWEKRKWLKHRLLNEDFLKVLVNLMKADAILTYKTDHEQYFDETLQLIQGFPQVKIRLLSRNLHNEDKSLLNIESEFEKLFKYKGLPVMRLDLQKNRKIDSLAV
jgi:tRNA (guanine-N7-)-methyltransferase